MRTQKKWCAVIGAFIAGVGCTVLGATLPKTAGSADTAVDYMENLQDLSYTTIVSQMLRRASILTTAFICATTTSVLDHQQKSTEETTVTS